MSWEWFPYTAYEAVRHMHTFEAVAVEGEVDAIASTSTWTEPAVAHMVSGNFSLLGAVAERLRTLGQADEQEGAGSIPVVLSHRFWAREFGSSAFVIGSTLSLQGQPFTVVGVMPQRFFGTTLDSSPDLWLPLSAQPLLSQKPLNDQEPDRHFAIFGRLRSDTTLAQAQAEFTGVYRATQRAEADTDPKEVGVIAPIEQGTFALREQFSHALTLLLCALAMLLLMVRANVAGLLLAKAVRNERDTAVRMALGASRGRLIRRALVETTILVDLLPAGRTPLPISLVPDWKIDFLAIGLSLVISLIFGVLPRMDCISGISTASVTKRQGNQAVRRSSPRTSHVPDGRNAGSACWDRVVGPHVLCFTEHQPGIRRGTFDRFCPESRSERPFGGVVTNLSRGIAATHSVAAWRSQR